MQSAMCIFKVKVRVFKGKAVKYSIIGLLVRIKVVAISFKS